MKVSEMADSQTTCYLTSLKIWSKEVQDIQSPEWMSVYGLLSSRFDKQVARACLRDLAKSYMALHLMEDAPYCPLLGFEPPVRSFTFQEAIHIFNRLSWAEQGILIVTLITGLSVEKVCRLTWKDARLKSWSDDVAEVYSTLPRHLTFDFLIWTHERGGEPQKIQIKTLRSKVHHFSGLALGDFLQVIKNAWSY